MTNLSEIMRQIDDHLTAAMADLGELATAPAIPIGEALELNRAAGDLVMALRTVRACALSLKAANIQYYRIDYPDPSVGFTGDDPHYSYTTDPTAIHTTGDGYPH